VYSNGTLTISNSTIAANTLQGGNGSDGYPFYIGFFGGNGGTAQGGGVYSNGTLTISNSTIAANQATGGTHGRGDIYGSDGPATGGGVYNQGMLQTDDTILAGNTVTGPGINTSPDLAGNLGSLGYNLIGNTQGGSGFDPTDLLNVDPLLGPLQDNGGPTQTMALLAGSPAIDAGNPNFTGPPFTDQRGFARVYNGRIDIGAFEYQPMPSTLTNTGSSGPGSLSQALVAAANQGAVSGSTQAIPVTGPGSSSMATASPAAAGPTAVSNTLAAAPGHDGSDLGSTLAAEGQRAVLDETLWAALGYHGRNDILPPLC
jgi:hypothetical protein